MYPWKGREEIKQTLFVIVNFCLTKLRYINILKGGGLMMLLVTLYWVSCDGLTSHPGGFNDAPSHFILSVL